MNTPKITSLMGLAVLGLSIATPSFAQKKAEPKAATKTATAKTTKGKVADGFSLLPSGLEYKIIKHGNGTRKPELNDHIEMYIHVHIDDSVLFDSRKMYGVNPVPYTIVAPKFKGDLVEGFMLMVAGDSAVFRLPVDSMKKMGQVLPWMKEGQKVEYDVAMISVRSEAEEKKHAEEKSAAQKGVDDKILVEYFAKNNLKPLKTSSGLYYVVHQEGSGPNVQVGNTATVNYTGMFLDGKKFDSNTDPDFHHVQAFPVEVGRGAVIKGWDEGLQLLKKGSKVTLYIPSALAYGAQDRNPIPANSILVFDIEVTDISTPEELKKKAEEKVSAQKEADDKTLREYFAKNKINATKTESGLYYVITQKGMGPNAKAGKHVTMNYTGKLLDGTVFDSNTDPKFNHVQPFAFQLGARQVIAGWDEGVALLNMGSKATLYIPSAQAYGPGGTRGIPPNSPLVFDVEVVGIDK